jgi:hypothetical protein
LLPQVYYFGGLPQEYSYTFALLLLISSIVIAAPNSQLDLPDDFNNLNVDTIFSREEIMREPRQEEEWRKPKPRPKQKREVRWGAKSIYEGDPQLEPFGSSSKNVSKGSKTPEAAPQFQLRF